MPAHQNEIKPITGQTKPTNKKKSLKFGIRKKNNAWKYQIKD
jgi:hypothetical protein